MSCIPCPPGYSCATGILSDIKLCPGGTFSRIGATTCTVCPFGFECPSTEQAILMPCPDGHFSRNGTCTLCEPGSICSEPASSTPTGVCLGVKEISGFGASTCSPCPSGYSCTGGDTLESIVKCSPGHYTDTSSEGCLTCPPGYKVGKILDFRYH